MSAATHLSAKHRTTLEAESGIATEIIAERGTFTARRGKDVPQGGGSYRRNPASSYRFTP